MTLTDAEAAELYRYMQHQYLDPNKWPALLKLLDRCDTHLGISEANVQAFSKRPGRHHVA